MSETEKKTAAGKNNEQMREEPSTMRDFLGQLFPLDIVDDIMEKAEKKRKQKEKGEREE